MSTELRPFKRKLGLQAIEALAYYGNCDLLLVGLCEVGLLGGKEWYWDCELFQIGLKELGLAA